MSLSRKLASITVLLLSCATAEASPISPYSLVGDLLFNQRPSERLSPNDFGSFALEDVASLNAAGVPSPSLTADASVGPSQLPSFFARADAILTYAMEIVGPAGDVPVVVTAAGVASAFADDGASFAVESQWALFDGSVALAGDDIRSGQLTGIFNQSFDRTLGLDLAANHLYTIFLLADAAAAATLEGSHATAHAFVDPLFGFGAGVDTSLYAFEFSPGIGNEAPGQPVPEPTSLVLLGTGFLLVRFRRGEGALLRLAERAGLQRYQDATGARLFRRQVPLYIVRRGRPIATPGMKGDEAEGARRRAAQSRSGLTTISGGRSL